MHIKMVFFKDNGIIICCPFDMTVKVLLKTGSYVISQPLYRSRILFKTVHHYQIAPSSKDKYKGSLFLCIQFCVCTESVVFLMWQLLCTEIKTVM